jgi:Cu+-exporting ATPase
MPRTPALVAAAMLALCACDQKPSTPAPTPSAASAAPAAEARPATQVHRIEVTDDGYAPASIQLKAGVPTELIFNQKSKQHCVSQVQAPDFGVPVTDLPFGKETTLRFTPQKEGSFKWACGMDMMSGTILVKG